MRENNEAIRLLELKNRVIKELESIMSRESIRKALKDPHSRRKPRPCGITIHPGHGCIFGCLYCYIYDMGFPSNEVKEYPLNSIELVYALASNPYIVPERTLAAYGSVTEPLLPKLRLKTINYITNVWRWLKLPSQVSTKEYIDEELASKLKKAEPKLSLLITIITLRYSKLLEPKAPDPILRFRGMRNASKVGLRVDLFLRPIIPGVTDNDVKEILELAKEHGAKGVVVGSLRVTKNIIKRLKSANVNTDVIVSRLVRSPKSAHDQVPITTSDIKNTVLKLAKSLGLDYLPSACSANILSHNMGCRLCKFGPCGETLYYVDEGRIREFMEYLGIKAVDVDVSGFRVTVKVRGAENVKREWLQYFLSEVYKTPFKIIL